MNKLFEAISSKFFKKKELNQFYLTMFLTTFAESLISIFVPIYLFNLGYPIYQILFFYFLLSIYFLLLAFPAAKIVSKIGEKHSILLSTPFAILYYLGLIFITKSTLLFFILPLFHSLRMVLFNYGFHLNFVTHSHQKKRGRELATFGIVLIIASALAPYIGSLLATINFPLAFATSSLLIILGTAPLFLTKDKRERMDFNFKGLFKKTFSKKNKGNFISFSGYAIESIIGRTIWPIFLIIIIGTISKTGLIISASLIISLLTFQFIGRLTDKVDKIRLLKIGTFLYFLGWVGRIFADTATKVLFIDSYKNISEKILQLPWEAHSYDLAKRNGYFEFIVSREIIFNIPRVIIFPILMFIFWIDFYPFITSFLIASISSLGYGFLER